MKWPFKRHLWSPHVEGIGGEYCTRCGALYFYPYPIIGSIFCKEDTMINDKIDTFLVNIAAAMKEDVAIAAMMSQGATERIPAMMSARRFQALKKYVEANRNSFLTLIEEIVNDVIGEDLKADRSFGSAKMKRNAAKNQLKREQRANFKKVMGK